MRRLAAMTCAVLAACSTPAEQRAPVGPIAAAPASAIVAVLPVTRSKCPAKTEVLYEPRPPDPSFVPAAPSGARVMQPLRLQGAIPYYPAASKLCGEEGTVVISYCVSADGRVENVQVTISSGYARLDNSVLAWAARDRHTPATVNGRPRRFCGLVAKQDFKLGAETDAATDL
ncbi:MAG: TonB family protein [Hyphomonadaceae bacterium]